MENFKHASLFSGIGGFDLAAELMGWENVFHCEKNEFCQKILKYYWPNAKTYSDITTTDFSGWAGKIDILTGGFPCQPYSVAGAQKGDQDERHLWPYMLRAIRQIKPPYVVGENVRGLVSWNDGLVFEQVCTDLENEGYEVQPCLLPAAGVNAPHKRDRIWFIAKRIDLATHPDNQRANTRRGEIHGTDEKIQQRHHHAQFGNTVERRSAQGFDTDTACLDKRRSANEANTVTASGHPRPEFSGYGERAIVTDPDGSGLQTQRAEQQAARPFEHGKLGGINKNAYGFRCDCSQCQSATGEREQRQLSTGANGRIPANNESFGYAADTECIGQSGSGQCKQPVNSTKDCVGQTDWLNSTYEIPDWTNWPTQPPLCSRNDGVSTGLDGTPIHVNAGLTKAKFREEQIKGYGNAIVPQVALQIFKALMHVHQTL